MGVPLAHCFCVHGTALQFSWSPLLRWGTRIMLLHWQSPPLRPSQSILTDALSTKYSWWFAAPWYSGANLLPPTYLISPPNLLISVVLVNAIIYLNIAQIDKVWVWKWRELLSMKTKSIALERLKGVELLKNTLKLVCEWGTYEKNDKN